MVVLVRVVMLLLLLVVVVVMVVRSPVLRTRDNVRGRLRAPLLTQQRWHSVHCIDDAASTLEAAAAAVVKPSPTPKKPGHERQLVRDELID